MAIKPVVRYMLLCEDWTVDPENNRRISILGLITNIRSNEDPPYPLLYPGICVFLALTEGRGQGEIRITCIFEENQERVFDLARSITFGPDPLEVSGASFRFRNIFFPRPGVYSVQLWYEGELLDERTLRLRCVMTNSGHNEGFRVLDDFVFEPTCGKIQNPESPCQGYNEGIRIVEDIVVELQRCQNERMRIVEDIIIDLKGK